MIRIHPSAIVDPAAQLEDGCEIRAGAHVAAHCQLGQNVVIHPHAVIGGEAQHLGQDPGIVAGVRIGRGTVIREHVTINRSMRPGHMTEIGMNCFLMAGSHIGHDCQVGDHVILANNVMLGGHVGIGDYVFIGGGAGIHQFTRVGEYVMVGGLSRITQDVAPFLMVVERNRVAGINRVGLRRRGLPPGVRREVGAIYHHLFDRPGNLRQRAAELLEAGNYQSSEARRFLEFFATGERGFARSRGGDGGQVVDTVHREAF